MHSHTTPSEPLQPLVPVQVRTSVTHGPHEFLSANQVADALKINPESLEDWRRKGRPLKWTSVDGRVRYRRTEVVQWLYNCRKNTLALEALTSVASGSHEFLSAGQVAYALCISPANLADWRRRGGPLKWTGIEGRVRYHRTEVVQWLFQCRREILAVEALTFVPVQDGVSGHD